MIDSDVSPKAQATLRILAWWSSGARPVVAGPWHIAGAIGEPSMQGYADAAKALAELQAAGRIRKIKPSPFAKDRQTAFWELCA